MAYSDTIAELNSSLSSISGINLKPSFDWEGKAKNKQQENINNLNSSLDGEVTSIKSLISALEAIDSYDKSKSEYEKYVGYLDHLNPDAENYESLKNAHERSRDNAKKDMDAFKEKADTLLNGISSSYKTKLSSVTTTKAVDTSVDLISDSLFVAPETSSNNNENNSSQKILSSTPTSSNNSSNYSSYSNYSGSHSSGSPSISTPYISDNAVQNYVVEQIDMTDVPEAPKETICAANTNLNVKSTRKDIKSCFSAETQKIISKHANDFNYSNFRNYIKNDEDFENYCKNILGGVFAKWVGKNKKGKGETASEFQEIAEYVFGLMVLYGFDYCNGDPDHYGKYGANDSGVASNAFYPKGVYNSPGKNDNTNGKNIDTICAGTTSDGINMTTNCNYGMDYLYYKAGILGGKGQPTSTCATGSLAKYAKSIGGGVTTNASELKVGDLIQFYRNPVPTSAATVENAGNLNKQYDWYHVACVGEVEKNAKGETVAVTLYEAGHYFTNSGNFKHRIVIDNNNLRNLGSSYKNKWVGINMNLTQDSYTTVK